MLRNLLLSLLILLSTQTVRAQQEAMHWVFGGFGGMDFSCTVPQLEVSPFDGLEGGACISNSSGVLQFSTDGDVVYSNDNRIMPNGRGIGGLCTLYGDYASSSQSAIIIPHPGFSHLYYIFTTDCAEDNFSAGLRYSIVDMTLNNGRGDVTEKNQQLERPVAEKIAAVYKTNNHDVWLVTHGIIDNKFYAYSITDAGLNTTPVTSSAGQVHPGGRGYMKFSPNGERIAVTSFVGGPNDGILPELFKFDKVTGKITSDFVLSGPSRSVYSLSFSPDSKMLYMSCGWTCIPTIFQYNLAAGTPTDVANSMFDVNAPNLNGALQLAPDGKLYFLTYEGTRSFVSVITNPNAPGAACNYVKYLIELPCSIGVSWGLPNFIESYFQDIVPGTISCQPPKLDFIQKVDFTPEISPNSFEVKFHNETVTNIEVARPRLLFTYTWDFGDGVYYSSYTPDDATHSYAGPGPYIATLTVAQFGCGPVTVPKEIKFPSLQVTFSYNSDCNSTKINYVNESTGDLTGVTWTWDFGDGTTSNLEDVTKIYQMFGNYPVRLIAKIGDVVSSSQQTVPVSAPVNFSFGDDATFCFGEPFTLSPGDKPGASFLWSTGATTPTLNITSPGNYSLKVTRHNCTAEDDITLTYSACELCDKIVKNMNLGSDTVLCEGDVLVLQVGDNVPGDFLWSNGSTGQTLSVTQSGKYWLSLVQGNCEASDTLLVDSRNCEKCDAIVPNVFTPNGDPKNQEFVFSATCDYYNFRMDIFNRWGKKLMSTTSPTWDGAIDNKIDDALYFYSIQYSFTGSQRRVITKRIKGWLQVMN